MRHTLHLNDLLSDADVVEPAPGHVELQYLEVGGDDRWALFEHPDSSVELPLPESFAGGTLHTACGVPTRAWTRLRSPVRFRVGVHEGDRDEVQWLWEGSRNPRKVERDRRWLAVEINLPPARTLVFETSARRPAHAAAGWADPVLVWDGPEPAGPRRRRAQPNVLLITAEACRPSYAEPPIPAADELAADGIRCAGARTVFTLGTGSSASLVTGRYPFTHGVVHDWGALPTSLPNLATELARAGYHTAFAPSRMELSRPAAGFARVFHEVLPCTTNPTEPGPATTRRVLRWLDEVRDERPWFLWVTYFDAHPPFRLPADLVRQFYEHDPRDPVHTHHPELVDGVHSIESLLHFDEAIPALRAGTVPPGLADRLRDTALTLEGARESGPDLASYLMGLGRGACRGLERHELARWLHAQAGALEAGDVDPALTAWLEDDVVPRLQDLERDSLLWIDGVVDRRYVVALARAGAAFVDAHVAELIAGLKDVGLYDDCTVAFCSPYVDVEGVDEHRSHHASLAEAVLQIPLVLKLRGGPAGLVVDGPIETVDLLPTLLDSLDLPLPVTDGVSRWADLRAGRRLPDHDCFALRPGAAEVAIVTGDYKLLRTLRPYAEDGVMRAPGTRRLFKLTGSGEEEVDDPSVAAALSGRLDEWLRRQGVPGP